MKEIPLTQGKVALVDDEDFERVNQLKWCAMWNGFKWYAINATGYRKYLHQFLLPDIPLIDHRNGNGLDCQRSNMRPADDTRNLRNAGKRRGSTSSRFKGVYWRTKTQIVKGKEYRYADWHARINIPKCIHLGYFDSEVSAALAYNEAALKHFGEFAKPNILPHVIPSNYLPL